MNGTYEIDAPLLDREVLDHHTMNNRALQLELFDLFFQQAPEYLESLGDALVTGSEADWRMTAHGVKGAARSLGFTRLAICAQAAEKAGPSQTRLDEIHATVEALRAQIAVEQAA